MKQINVKKQYEPIDVTTVSIEQIGANKWNKYEDKYAIGFGLVHVREFFFQIKIEWYVNAFISAVRVRHIKVKNHKNQLILQQC